MIMIMIVMMNRIMPVVSPRLSRSYYHESTGMLLYSYSEGNHPIRSRG